MCYFFHSPILPVCVCVFGTICLLGRSDPSVCFAVFESSARSDEIVVAWRHLAAELTTISFDDPPRDLNETEKKTPRKSQLKI